jgi:hypothetical protein
MPESHNFPDTEPQNHRSSHGSRQAPDGNSTGDDENLSISDRALRDLRDERISASSDGHGTGIPLSWDDDDL